MRFERKAVLAALRRQVEQGRAILAAAAGNGLVARVEDRGGADLIIVYNSGRYRMDGIASIAGMPTPLSGIWDAVRFCIWCRIRRWWPASTGSIRPGTCEPSWRN